MKTMINAQIDLADIDDDDLIEEMKDRELIGAEINDDLALIYRAVIENRKEDTLGLLERLMRPKFRTLYECMAAKRACSDYLFRAPAKNR